jgi:Cu+-exporting ATPase
MFETGTNVIDPVCGMTIDRDDAVRVEYDGRQYSFCDPACASIFHDEPARWIDDHGRSTFEHEH